LRALHLLAALHHSVPEWKGEWWAYHPALAPAPKKTVSWSGTVTILALLRETLDDPEPRLRLAAIEGLRSAADTNASVHLRRRFDRETTQEVRRAIIGVLGEFKDMAFAEVLARVLRDSTNDADTSRAAIRAAARLGGGVVTSALLDLLDLPALDPELRAEIAQALGELKERKAIARLQPLMTDA
jgi:HEAT repeat protein